MEYNCKLVCYADDIQTVFYDKKYKRKEGGAESDNNQKFSKNSKHNSIDSVSSTWYNPKTSSVEVIPEGFRVIQHPFFNHDMLFPLDEYIDKDVWIDMDFELMLPIVQKKIQEQEQRKKVANSFRSLRRAKQTIYSICRANRWELFVTFTIANKDMRYDLQEVKKLVSTRIRSIRTHQHLNFGYILIPEQHKDGAWHFHGLFKDIQGLHLERAVNQYGKRIISNNMQVYSIKEFESIGFNSATFVQDNSKVCRYITKYVTKDLMESSGSGKAYLNSQGLSRGEELLFDVECEDDVRELLTQACGYEPTLTHGSIGYNPYKDCNIVYKQYRK